MTYQVRRNHGETIDHATQAVTSGTSHFGVKGPSMVMLLPKFDIIRGFVPEYMHSVLLGVVRMFIDLWLDSSHHNEPYYIRDVRMIDCKLAVVNHLMRLD